MAPKANFVLTTIAPIFCLYLVEAPSGLANAEKQPTPSSHTNRPANSPINALEKAYQPTKAEKESQRKILNSKLQDLKKTWDSIKSTPVCSVFDQVSSAFQSMAEPNKCLDAQVTIATNDLEEVLGRMSLFCRRMEREASDLQSIDPASTALPERLEEFRRQLILGKKRIVSPKPFEPEKWREQWASIASENLPTEDFDLLNRGLNLSPSDYYEGDDGDFHRLPHCTVPTVLYLVARKRTTSFMSSWFGTLDSILWELETAKHEFQSQKPRSTEPDTRQLMDAFRSSEDYL